MYPDLSYFFHDLLGTQPDNWTAIFKTFGLFLGLALVSSGYLLYHELKRKEGEGLIGYQIEEVTKGLGVNWVDLISNALIGFILGFKIPFVIQNFEAFKVDPSGVIFNKQGNLLLGLFIAILIGGILYWQGLKSKLDKPITSKVKVFPHQSVSNITMIAGLFGVLGARLFSIAENMGAFFRDPIGVLFAGSGLNVLGGLVIGFLAMVYYAKKKGIKTMHFLDAMAPTFILGYAVGRLGCQFSGDGDWGIVNAADKPSWFFLPDWLWAYNYPRNVNNEGIPIEGCDFLHCMQLSPPVYPTPLYEIAICAIILGVAWVLRKRFRHAGMMFFMIIFLNGIERFFIEGIRVNDRYEMFGLHWSQAQYIAVLMVLIGVVGFIWTRRQEPFEVRTA